MGVLTYRKTITLTLCFVGLIGLVVGIFLLVSKERSSVASKMVGATSLASDAWAAERVADLAEEYAAGGAAKRQTLMPKVLDALKSYRKEWQGSEEKQALFESSYLDLASSVKTDCGDSEAAGLANDVEGKGLLRMRYLTDKNAIGKDAEEARRLLDRQEFARCEDLCTLVISGNHARQPFFELLLGMAHMGKCELTRAAAKFKETNQLCREKYPAIAVRAAYLAGIIYIQEGDYGNGLEMLRIVLRDHSGSAEALRAQRLCRQLEEIAINLNGA